MSNTKTPEKTNHIVYVAKYGSEVMYIGEGKPNRPKHLTSGTSHVYLANKHHFEGKSLEVDLVCGAKKGKWRAFGDNHVRKELSKYKGLTYKVYNNKKGPQVDYREMYQNFYKNLDITFSGNVLIGMAPFGIITKCGTCGYMKERTALKSDMTNWITHFKRNISGCVKCRNDRQRKSLFYMFANDQVKIDKMSVKQLENLGGSLS